MALSPGAGVILPGSTGCDDVELCLIGDDITTLLLTGENNCMPPDKESMKLRNVGYNRTKKSYMSNDERAKVVAGVGGSNTLVSVNNFVAAL